MLLYRVSLLDQGNLWLRLSWYPSIRSYVLTVLIAVKVDIFLHRTRYRCLTKSYRKYLFLDGLEWFYYSTNTEVIVILWTIKCTDYQVNNTEMVVICLLLSLSHLCGLLLLSLQSFHNFLSFFIFIDHNVAHTEIGNNNSSEAEHVISIFVYNWLIISNGFIISLEYKENMGDIQFPSLMISTKLSTLPE